MCYITRGNVAKVYSLTAYILRMGQITFPITSQNWSMKICIIIIIKDYRIEQLAVTQIPFIHQISFTDQTP